MCGETSRRLAAERRRDDGGRVHTPTRKMKKDDEMVDDNAPDADE